MSESKEKRGFMVTEKFLIHVDSLTHRVARVERRLDDLDKVRDQVASIFKLMAALNKRS